MPYYTILVPSSKSKDFIGTLYVTHNKPCISIERFHILGDNLGVGFAGVVYPNEIQNQELKDNLNRAIDLLKVSDTRYPTELVDLYINYFVNLTFDNYEDYKNFLKGTYYV